MRPTSLAGWLDDLFGDPAKDSSSTDDWNSEGSPFGTAVDRLPDSVPWVARWRREGRRALDRLHRLGVVWGEVRAKAQAAANAAPMGSPFRAYNLAMVHEADERRVAYRRAIDWIMLVAQHFLGGVNTLGAFPVVPVLAITVGGAVISITVDRVFDWLDTEEERARVAEASASEADSEARMLSEASRMAASPDPATAEVGRRNVDRILSTRSVRAAGGPGLPIVPVIAGSALLAAAVVYWRRRRAAVEVL